MIKINLFVILGLPESQTGGREKCCETRASGDVGYDIMIFVLICHMSCIDHVAVKFKATVGTLGHWAE